MYTDTPSTGLQREARKEKTVCDRDQYRKD